MELTSSRWASNADVRLHYLDNDPAEPVGLPIFFSPGFHDFASDYEHLLEFFAPRRFVVVEVRGRGRSDSPTSGYAASDHVGDLEAVLDATGIDRFHLMTFSRGTTWGLDLAIRHAPRVATVSIGDYQAVEHRVDPALVETAMNARFRGIPVRDRFQPHVPQLLFEASQDRDLFDGLASIGCPVLVALGTEPGHMVSADDVEEYRRRVPGVEFVTVTGAAHDVFRSHRTDYPAAIVDLIARHPERDV